MKKVLIIGARGTLGQELTRVFSLDKNYEVSSWDFSEIDITDRERAERKIDDLGPEIIINAAAYNAVDKAEEPEEFEKAKALNGLAPGYLARAAKKIGAIFVHYSTDYVFDGQEEDGYKEGDRPSPICNYGHSKLLGEQEVQASGGKFYIIRLQKLFNKISTESLGGNSKKSFFELMESLSQTKTEIEAVDEELANFTFAPDLAERTKFIVENGLPCGIYHITNEGLPVTWFGAAKIYFELAGKNIKLTPVSADKFPRPAKRPRYSILLNTKLPSLRSWVEALKDSL